MISHTCKRIAIATTLIVDVEEKLNSIFFPSLNLKATGILLSLVSASYEANLLAR